MKIYIKSHSRARHIFCIVPCIGSDKVDIYEYSLTSGCDPLMPMPENDRGHLNRIEKVNQMPEMSDYTRSGRIYTDYFQLTGTPFSITPDPDFLFLSETHQSVIEKIQYAIQCKMGFMLMTGEVGTGKTTLCRALLDRLGENVRTVYIINPSLSACEIMAGILEDLGLACRADASKKELIDQLNRFLLENESSFPVVIIIDDAQTMPLSTLEDLRLLSNLETDKSKLLQILVVGQPELLDHLNRPEMRQLKQRVAIHCYLEHLTCDEVRGYIERRLFIVGNQGQVRFASKAIKLIHAKSGGIPRMINKICDLALTAAYSTNSTAIGSRHVRSACAELIDLHRPAKEAGKGWLPEFRWPAVAMGFALAMVIGFAAYPYLHAIPPVHLASSPQISDLPQPDQPEPVRTEELTPQDNPDLPVPALKTGAYILQLGSYKNIVTTLRAIDIYRRKGIKAQWNAIDLGEKGTWFRVFAGRFPSMTLALDFQKARGLNQARVLHAAWAVSLGPVERRDELKEFIDTDQFDSYIAHGEDSRPHLYSGAYVSRERAAVMARRISKHTGLPAGVTAFGLPQVPMKSQLSFQADGDRS